ncbi:hypothetical protein [Natrialba sp. SSL1]|uniref:hypothetical protein n=1 Tax=Natrialba sp. SSL1 TaxID=1869245 RepID=UPI0008F8CB15|nr:hypothetical protein [Natrialba sp. SSL1]OIB58845.1 hypothetical protein BBD46_06480 [Natrialba sp. SSL1]
MSQNTHTNDGEIAVGNSRPVVYQQALEQYLDEELEETPDSRIEFAHFYDDFSNWYQKHSDDQPPATPWFGRAVQASGLETEQTPDGKHLLGWAFS